MLVFLVVAAGFLVGCFHGKTHPSDPYIEPGIAEPTLVAAFVASVLVFASSFWIRKRVPLALTATSIIGIAVCFAMKMAVVRGLWDFTANLGGLVFSLIVGFAVAKMEFGGKPQ